MSTNAFSHINLAACLVAVALLLFLFTYPHGVFTKMENSLCSAADATIAHIMAGEWAQATEGIDSMISTYENNQKQLRLFLNHEDIDTLREALYGCKRLIAAKDDKQVLAELERVSNIAIYIKNIETFNLFNLF